MCGICGTVGRANAHELEAMTDSMIHRGPDGRGVTVFDGEPPAGLGHRRLAIIDPTPAGAQPMGFGDRWWITYNGELYNFRELRRELEIDGESFASECDTEVLLRLFVTRGPRMLDDLNGIFAFAVWDDVEKRLFLARDRLGVKPLYYTNVSGCFAFASELKALLPLIGTPSIDETALADYLTFLWVPDPKTAFREVRKLPPGHFAWFDSDGLRAEEYWDLRFSPEHRSEDEWGVLVANAVTESAQRQMVSDVPLGSFLSGGVDSSAIVAAMSQTGDPVSTYTIGFSKADLEHEIVPDDLRYARGVGQLFATDYHETILKPDVLELFPKAVWHLEEPVADPAAISTYLICREARKIGPVMLSGMGGDEVFAGYPRYLAYKISRLLDVVPRPFLGALGNAMAGVARPGKSGRFRGPRRNLWKFMRGAHLPPADRYLSFSSYYARHDLNELLVPELRRELQDYDPLARHRSYLQQEATGDELSRLLYLDAKTFLPCLNLAYTDKMGMAASVEVRVPLLDDELVALAARIPSNLKIKHLQRKFIFKRSQEDKLPREIIWRRKAGFGAPIRSWLEKDLGPLMADLLSDESIRARGLIRPQEVRRMQHENTRGIGDYSLQLYALLTLELWHRTFLDRAWSFESIGAAPLIGPLL
jgi:asparagine synthase (glutamine-hydrolysing)